MRKENFFAVKRIIYCSIIYSFYINNYGYCQQNKVENEVSLTDDSYRLTLDLGTPRRFSSRFNNETRTLQLRIVPARAEEVKNSSFYDTRYIQRIIVEEKNSEVVLNIQLKNFPISWVIATQKEPWRILVDFWRTEKESLTLNEQWDWQPNYISGFSNEKNGNGLPSSVSINNTENNKFETNNLKFEANKSKINKLKSHKDNSERFLLTNKNSKRYDLPEIYTRLDPVKHLSDAKKSELAKQIGNLFGSKNEFLAAKNLADELYAGAEEAKALTIYRKLAALDEGKFKENDNLLWQAGESAFLEKSFDISNDYLRTLLIYHPGSTYLSFARLRITDIDELTNSKNKGFGKIGNKNAETYSNLALSQKNPSIIKIAASLRLLDGVVDENLNTVKTYQQNLDTCVTSSRIAFDLLKNCAYYRDRYLAEKDNITSADIAVQQFKRLSPDDNRIVKLENIVQGRVKSLLTETAKNKDWITWVELEKKLRPALLTFTFSNAEFLFTRAEAFEAVGENKKAIQLYDSFLKTATDLKKKNEAACLAALLLYRLNEPKKANEFLKQVELDEKRKTEGLTDKSVEALKELTLTPYQNKLALNLLMDEIKLGRYEERTLTTLFEWSKELRGKPQAELIYEKILAYPAKSSDEVQIVETSIMRFADDLRDSGRFAKSGDMFFAVANLAQGTHRAETAYKAGVVYARAGLFDKAKAAWLLAANDTNDKRYSALANERLDRINK